MAEVRDLTHAVKIKGLVLWPDLLDLGSAVSLHVLLADELKELPHLVSRRVLVFLIVPTARTVPVVLLAVSREQILNDLLHLFAQMSL